MRRESFLLPWIYLLLGTSVSSPRLAAAAWPTDPTVNVPLCTASGSQTSPRMVSDGAGGAIVTWQDDRNTTDSDLYAMRVLSGGVVDPAWPVNGVVVCSGETNQAQPRITTDGAGGAIITWIEARDPLVTGIDIYAQHVKSNGTIDPAWPANGRALCVALNDQSSPIIASDGAGGAIVSWQDLRSGTNHDVYAQRVTGAGVNAWSSDGVPLCTLPSGQFVGDLVEDGAGGAIVTWQDRRNGADFDVYAQHVRSTGSVDPAWTANGVAVCAVAGEQTATRIISDGAGGGLLVWYDIRSGVNDIYGQHVLAGGTADPAWPAGGLSICSATEHQIFPVLVSDGVGGAIVAWQDRRVSLAFDVYSQHVLAGGTPDPLWPVNGLQLCGASGSQTDLSITSDGAGGAIVGWLDTRNPSSDVYAQHVVANGTLHPAWPVDGLGTSTAAGEQTMAQVVTDGSGGAIAAWRDARSGSTDVYAQRVLGDGQIGEAVAVGSRGASQLSLLPAWPNPVRGSSFAVNFTLDGSEHATLELIDATGRRVALRDLGSLAMGPHQVTLGEGLRLRPGIYLVRLRQGERVRVASVSVLR